MGLKASLRADIKKDLEIMRKRLIKDNIKLRQRIEENARLIKKLEDINKKGEKAHLDKAAKKNKDKKEKGIDKKKEKKGKRDREKRKKGLNNKKESRIMIIKSDKDTNRDKDKALKVNNNIRQIIALKNLERVRVINFNLKDNL